MIIDYLDSAFKIFVKSLTKIRIQLFLNANIFYNKTSTAIDQSNLSLFKGFDLKKYDIINIIIVLKTLFLFLLSYLELPRNEKLYH